MLRLSPAQYSLTSAESWPKISIISFHLSWVFMVLFFSCPYATAAVAMVLFADVCCPGRLGTMVERWLGVDWRFLS